VGHTNRIILQHAHHGGGPGALEGVEEARHGHGDEAHMHQASLGCKRELS
jgi:hypothetical protein